MVGNALAANPAPNAGSFLASTVLQVFFFKAFHKITFSGF
jgi:hypothetical protein